MTEKQLSNSTAVDHLATTPQPNSEVIKMSSTVRLLLVICILLSVVIFVLIFTLVKANKANQNQDSQSIVNEITPTSVDSTDSASQQPNQVKKYTHKKIDSLPFEGFTIEYPSHWTLNLNESTNKMLFFSLISQNGSTLKITQAPMGGGGCLFSNDADREGPYGRYGEYVVFKPNPTTEWRRAEYLGEIPEMRKTYSVCEKQSESFASLTKIGGIEYLFPLFDEETLSEMDKILSSITIESN